MESGLGANREAPAAERNGPAADADAPAAQDGHARRPGTREDWNAGTAAERAWVPIPEAPGPVQGPAQGPAGADLPSAAQGLRILVVDDHPMNRKLLVQFLASYGIRADMAASGQEALDACAARPYHAVFLDCHMPGMDGYACARRLREGKAPVRRPILIGVTADSSETALRRCLEAGMDDLLPKPILERRLRAIVAECVERLG
jgi:CheY-like chemotaxis protein